MNEKETSMAWTLSGNATTHLNVSPSRTLRETSVKHLRIVQILRTALAVSLLGAGLAACVAQGDPDPTGSNARSTESDLTSPLSGAAIGNTCVPSPRPTRQCVALHGWQWCGCPDPDDHYPTGWVCGFCE